MDEAKRWIFVFLFFGFICIAIGRVPKHHNPYELNLENRIESNELFERRNVAIEQYKQERLSLAEFSTYNLQEPNGPGTYAFGYDNVVDSMGNEQFRNEEKLQNGTVVGEYGYTDYKNKKIVRVTYTADTRGYRAKTQILPLDV